MDSTQILSHCNHSQLVNTDIFIKGQGDLLYTSDRTYRDLTSGLWNVNWGYNSDHYADIIRKQVDLIQYYPNCFHSTTAVTQEAARAITEYYSMAGVYFGTGGSDSIRVSQYIARYSTGRSQIISHALGYHGSVQSVSTSMVISQMVSNDTAAVIVEPVMTTSGVIEFPHDELVLLDQLRAQLGFLIIFDETVTGLRTTVNSSIVPDLRIVSKGLTNGLFPFSATLVSEQIMRYIQTSGREFDFGLTMSGHPIGSALMLKSLELYRDSQVLRSDLERDIRVQLKGCSVRAHGLLFGIDLPDAALAHSELKSMGYIIHRAELTNSLIFAPMFTADLNDYQTFFNYIRAQSNELY